MDLYLVYLWTEHKQLAPKLIGVFTSLTEMRKILAGNLSKYVIVPVRADEDLQALNDADRPHWFTIG